MRRYTFFAILISLSVFLLAACKKDGDKIPKGDAHALYNGSDWNAEPVAHPSRFGKEALLDLAFYIQNRAYNTQGLLFDNVNKKFDKQRLYQIKPQNQQLPDTLLAFFYTSQDYDVTGDEYTIVESDSVNNWIKITSAEDNFTKNIRGEFSATFVRTKTFLNSPYPDTVRFLNGTFYISKIKE